MSLLARLYTFAPGGVIRSSEVNAELNQLVNILNGTSVNKEVSIKATTTDPAIAIDQLSTGNIVSFRKSGTDLVKILNTGQIRSEVSTLAPITAPVGAAGFICTNINADQLDGVEGINYLRNNLATLQQMIGNLQILKDNPQFILSDDTLISGGTPQLRIEIIAAGTSFRFITDRVGITWLTVAEATGIPTFNVLPEVGSDPGSANQLTRKSYVDGKKSTFSASFYYSTIPGAVETVESVPVWICPEGTSITITKLKLRFSGGSHTPGTASTWTLKRRSQDGSLQSDPGSVTLGDGAVVNNLYDNDIGDVVLTAGDQLYFLFTTRTGTPTETGVTVGFIGTQLLT